jgi:uncharacterized SAM-binding protein YcdF (DUF218 family)
MNKLIAILIAVALGVGGFIYLISKYLPLSNPLEKSDAIVAISGGDTTGRTKRAIELYKDGWAPEIIFSGAAKDPNSPSNAIVMKRQALKAGVPESAITIDETSRTTYENAQTTKPLVKDYNSVILVTSDYHQRRAYKEFRRIYPSSVAVINSPANDKNWGQKSWFFTPYGWWISITEPLKLLLQ